MSAGRGKLWGILVIAALMMVMALVVACGGTSTATMSPTNTPNPTPEVTVGATPTPTSGPTVVAASPSPQSQVELTDIAGRTVTVNLPVDRIILGEGRQIYILAALESENPFSSVVGWRDDLRTSDLDTYNKYLEKYPEIESIPIFGDPSGGEFSVEQALDLRPDLLILNLDALEGAEEVGLIDKLAEVGVPTIVVDFRELPLENTTPSIMLLGKVLGQEARAQEMVDFYLEQVNKVYSRVAEIEGTKPTVLIDRAPGAGFFGESVCCATFGRANLGLLVERVGANHLGSELVPGWSGELNPEQVLVSDPDVIIATGSNWSQTASGDDPAYVRLGYNSTVEEARAALERLADRPGWDALQAVQSGQFYAIWHQFYNSPYHFVALQQFAKWIYPEEFDDLDPEATFKEFHDRFLPIEYSGAFWATLK